MNPYIYYKKTVNTITVPAIFLEEGVLLAKENSCNLEIDCHWTSSISWDEWGAIQEKEVVLDFSVLALYSELPEFDISESAGNITGFKNIEQLYKMEHLTRFVPFNSFKFGFDVSRIPNLKSLAANPSTPKHVVNIGKALKLETLQLWGYKGKDLTEFANLKNLTYLDLINPSIHSLDGIEHLPQLERFDLYGGRNLTDVSVLKSMPNLRGLSLPKKFKQQEEEIYNGIRERVLKK